MLNKVGLVKKHCLFKLAIPQNQVGSAYKTMTFTAKSEFKIKIKSSKLNKFNVTTQISLTEVLIYSHLTLKSPIQSL